MDPRPTKRVIYIDTSVLIDMEQGLGHSIRSVIERGRAQGHEFVLPLQTVREYLHIDPRLSDPLRKGILERRLHIIEDLGLVRDRATPLAARIDVRDANLTWRRLSEDIDVPADTGARRGRRR